MKILVCIKPVNEPERRADGTLINTTDLRMNRFDEYALEEALQIRESFPSSTVCALSLGPESAEPALKRAMGMGAGHAVHIRTEDAPSPDPYIIAKQIAEYAKNEKYDLILTGVMSEDLMQGQVGPMLGEMLGMNCATAVIHLSMGAEDHKIHLKREIEGGAREGWSLPLPALLTIQTGINKPRYPALSQMLRAAKQKVEVIRNYAPDDFPTRQEVIKTSLPQKERPCLTLEGTPMEKARALTAIFREKGFLKEREASN